MPGRGHVPFLDEHKPRRSRPSPPGGRRWRERYRRDRGGAERLRATRRSRRCFRRPFSTRSRAGVLVKAQCLQKTGFVQVPAARARRPLGARPGRADPAWRAGDVLGQPRAGGGAGGARGLGIWAPRRFSLPSDGPAPESSTTPAPALGATVVTYDRETADPRRAGTRDRGRNAALTAHPPLRPRRDVIAGQGTCGVSRCARQAAEAGVGAAEVLVCCGGGGLSAGIRAGARSPRAGPARGGRWNPEGVRRCRPLARRRDAAAKRPDHRLGRRRDPDPPRRDELTYPILRRLAGPGLAVSDDAAFPRHGGGVPAPEDRAGTPGGAVALAAALFLPEALEAETVIAVATGGNVGPGCLRPRPRHALSAGPRPFFVIPEILRMCEPTRPRTRGPPSAVPPNRLGMDGNARDHAAAR